MIRLPWILPIAMTAACATVPPTAETLRAADSALHRTALAVGALGAAPSAAYEAAAPTELVAAVEPKEITINELDTGLICEQRDRPGSRVKQSYCYTRAEYTASQAERSEQIQELMYEIDREQQIREAERMAELERQRLMRAMGRSE